MAQKVEQLQEAMKDPAMQQQLMAYQQMMQNPALIKRMQELRDDPDMKVCERK